MMSVTPLSITHGICRLHKWHDGPNASDIQEDASALPVRDDPPFSRAMCTASPSAKWSRIRRRGFNNTPIAELVEIGALSLCGYTILAYIIEATSDSHLMLFSPVPTRISNLDESIITNNFIEA